VTLIEINDIIDPPTGAYKMHRNAINYSLPLSSNESLIEIDVKKRKLVRELKFQNSKSK